MSHASVREPPPRNPHHPRRHLKRFKPQTLYMWLGRKLKFAGLAFGVQSFGVRSGISSSVAAQHHSWPGAPGCRRCSSWMSARVAGPEQDTVRTPTRGWFFQLQRNPKNASNRESSQSSEPRNVPCETVLKGTLSIPGFEAS